MPSERDILQLLHMIGGRLDGDVSLDALAAGPGGRRSTFTGRSAGSRVKPRSSTPCVFVSDEVEDASQSEQESEELPFALVVSRADSIDSHTINGITIGLARLAREHGGRDDGWACAVTWQKDP